MVTEPLRTSYTPVWLPQVTVTRMGLGLRLSRAPDATLLAWRAPRGVFDLAPPPPLLPAAAPTLPADVAGPEAPTRAKGPGLGLLSGLDSGASRERSCREPADLAAVGCWWVAGGAKGAPLAAAGMLSKASQTLLHRHGPFVRTTPTESSFVSKCAL